MATRDMGYDHPAYQDRKTHQFGQNTAGASSNLTNKFNAFTACTLYAVQAIGVTNGTSTYTAWNGTGTVVGINGDQFSVIRITNTAAAGAAAALSTSTYGPYIVATGTGTTTGAAGIANYITLSQTGVGSNSSNGGISINKGDQIGILRGTDATAVTNFAIEYGITPLAPVAA
jgi:hypothetical protein